MATAQTGRKLQFTSKVQLNGLLSPKNRRTRASDYTMLVSWSGDYPVDTLRRNEEIPVAEVARMVQSGKMGGYTHYINTAPKGAKSKRGYHAIKRWPFFEKLLKSRKSAWRSELDRLFRRFTTKSGDIKTGKAREHYAMLQRFGGKMVREIKKKIASMDSPPLSEKTVSNRRYLKGKGRDIISETHPLTETGQLMRSVVVEVVRNEKVVSLKNYDISRLRRYYPEGVARPRNGSSYEESNKVINVPTHKPSEAYTPEFNIEGKGLFDDILTGGNP